MLSSMWVSRTTVVVASVLMMFIPDSASKPQESGIIGVPKNDADFLNLLDPGSDQVSGCPSVSESCVLIDMCCDVFKPTESPSNVGNLTIDPESGAPEIFDLDFVNPKGNINIDVTSDRSNSNPCSVLQICCEKKCVTEVTPPPPPPPSNQCGIRNTEGFRVTLMGTDQESQYGEFPWMVAVLSQGNDEYVGGGSLVHRRIVLTAAHKVHGKSGFVARIGDWDLSATIDEELVPAQAINVKKVLPHPDFSRKTLVNNVALLILESDAELGDTVMPICLPEPNQVFDGSECTVTGWGKNDLDTGKFQKVLKKVNVPVVSHNECQSMLRNTRLGPTFNLHNTFNCAGGDGNDSCEGDGGSPLICPKPNNPNEYVQMGVTAWGIGCGIKGNPGVYGSVPTTVDWIHQVIKEEGGKINPRG